MILLWFYCSLVVLLQSCAVVLNCKCITAYLCSHLSPCPTACLVLLVWHPAICLPYFHGPVCPEMHNLCWDFSRSRAWACLQITWVTGLESNLFAWHSLSEISFILLVIIPRCFVSEGTAKQILSLGLGFRTVSDPQSLSYPIWKTQATNIHLDGQLAIPFNHRSKNLWQRILESKYVIHGSSLIQLSPESRKLKGGIITRL